MKRLDLTNQIFGKLIALEPGQPYVKPSGKKISTWKCKCECGKILDVRTENLRTGKAKSCGCSCGRVDITNQKFGRLTVLEYVGNSSWKCKCDCGNIKTIKTANLKNGNTKSCGCLQKEKVKEAIWKDLTNQKFGRLTVLFPTEKKQGSNIIWHCKCDCGKECDIAGNNLTSGNSTSCGCFKIENTKELLTKNLIGQKFGRLTVIEKTEERDGRSIIWLCKCECGNFKKISSRNLIHDKIKSCGCLRSLGEGKIEKILKENNISFMRQKTFSNCINLNTGYPLYFDFYINDFFLLEFDGIQHFKYTNNDWNTKENFEKTKLRDKIKDEYCLINNIPLKRIPYWEIDNLTLELIMSDKYLINEKENNIA